MLISNQLRDPKIKCYLHFLSVFPAVTFVFFDIGFADMSLGFLYKLSDWRDGGIDLSKSFYVSAWFYYVLNKKFHEFWNEPQKNKTKTIAKPWQSTFIVQCFYDNMHCTMYIRLL